MFPTKLKPLTGVLYPSYSYFPPQQFNWILPHKAEVMRKKRGGGCVRYGEALTFWCTEIYNSLCSQRERAAIAEAIENQIWRPRATTFGLNGCGISRSGWLAGCSLSLSRSSDVLWRLLALVIVWWPINLRTSSFSFWCLFTGFFFLVNLLGVVTVSSLFPKHLHFLHTFFTYRLCL